MSLKMDQKFKFDEYAVDVSERPSSTPLTRILQSGEVTQEREQELTRKERFDRWMINEGYRRM